MPLIPDVHDAAYKLFEIRSWHDLKRFHRLRGKSPEGTVDASQCEFKSELEMVLEDDEKKK